MSFLVSTTFTDSCHSCDDEPQRLRDTEMHNYDGLNADVTERIIGCAIEVHRHLGPGLLESVYESAMCLELRSARLPFVRQIGVPLFYKGELIAEHRPDLVVDDQVVWKSRASSASTQCFWLKC